MVSGIVPEHRVQRQLFNQVDWVKQERLIKAIAAINGKYGRNTVRLDVQGYLDKNTPWQLQKEHVSKRYTTNWQELWTVNA